MKNLRTKELANLLGVTPQTIRKYVDNDQIPYHKTPNNQLFFTQKDVETILGEAPVTQTIWAHYIRSSSGSQKLLNNQAEQLINKYEKPEYLIKDSASGLNENRKGLQKLIALAQEGKITDIAITTQDRLTRFGYKYLETLFTQNNVKIHILNQTENTTPEQELLDDFMALIASFSGRFYKLRTKENKQKLLEKAQKELDND